MTYSHTNRYRHSASRSRPIDVIRGAATRRPAPLPRQSRAFSPDERYAPMIMGEDGTLRVHPDFPPNMN